MGEVCECVCEREGVGLFPRDRWRRETWGGTGVKRDEQDKDGDSSQLQLCGDKDDEL